MLRPFVVLGLLCAFALPLAAQDKPTAEMKAAISGTWHLDRARSDTIPYDQVALILRGGGGRRGGRGNALSDPKTRTVLLEARILPSMVITAEDTLLTIADSAGSIVEWRTDGKKRQEAQFEGGVIESQAGWKYGDLFVLRGIPNGLYVRREYKPAKDAKSLEIKLTFEGSKKIETKFVYTKA